MYDALVNIFELVRNEIINPIWLAIDDTSIFDPLISFANGLLNNLFRIFNDNNVLKYSITSDIIAWVIGLIVLIIIIELTYAIFKIVFTAFETIQSNINSFDNKQRWKKRGGHKKKWNY